jgi:VanZ family protein
MEHMKKVVKKIWSNSHVRRIERWAFLFLWMGGIFVLSSQPNLTFSNGDTWEFIIRKIGHAFVFGMLAFLIFRILGVTEKRRIEKNIFFAFVFAVLYAISDEFHQTMVTGRHGVLSDVMIDSVGALVSVWILHMNYHFHKQRPKLTYTVKHDDDFIWDI